ncbi:MAG: hypothetical protein RR466_09070, partial [Hungatella sp.]
MPQEHSIVRAVRNYFLGCPFLKDGKFNIDYLPGEQSYSIDTMPSDPVYKRYTDGGCIYQYEYTFTSKEAYDGDMRTMVDNSMFYQRLMEWIETQEDTGNLPEIAERNVLANRVTSNGYLFSVDSDMAQYQMQFRL